ncbi:hypothetical protein Tco_0475077, partial [Tanacetum coccineum]
MFNKKSSKRNSKDAHSKTSIDDLKKDIHVIDISDDEVAVPLSHKRRKQITNGQPVNNNNVILISSDDEK